jgi:hypothetical protein
MVSDFAKRQAAERAARSQFKMGTDVAIVHTHFERRILGKRKVAKVLANGNFTITYRDGMPDPTRQQYRPDWSGTSATPTGDRGFSHSREHLEVWSKDIEDEVLASKQARIRKVRVDRIVARLADPVGDGALDEIEKALGLTPK